MKNLFKNIISLPKRLVNFFRFTFRELKKVKWLSRKQTLRYSVYVITMLVLGAGFILLLDKSFLFLRNLVLNG